jgi:hypothetical protein
LGFLAAACSGDDQARTGPTGIGPDAGADSGHGGGAGGASGDGGASGAFGGSAGSDSGPDPCLQAQTGPDTSTTYYVAIGVAGADNASCDGLTPTDEGGGHCPFRDFSSPRTASLLDGVVGVKVVVREGTYLISGWDGLRVTGAGSSEADRVVLTSYPGENVVFDTPSPDGALCTGADPTSNPNCVRQVVRMSGSYTWVQGIRVQNGLAYDAEVTGGAHHVIRCMKFGYTAEFAQRSDQVKLDGHADDIHIYESTFTAWHSQGVDMTQVTNVVVEDNEFFAPHDADSGATGDKFGARGVVIRNNRVHDLGSDVHAHVFSLGGTGSPHPDSYEAEDIHVIGNHVSKVAGILAQVVSCKGCSVEDNDLSNAGAGILVSAAAVGSPECSASANGCLPSERTRITGNRMRGLNGGGDPAQANVFVAVDAGADTGIEAGDNLYCSPSAGDARFVWGASAGVGLAEWQALCGTDATSRAMASGDPECSAF